MCDVTKSKTAVDYDAVAAILKNSYDVITQLLIDNDKKVKPEVEFQYGGCLFS